MDQTQFREEAITRLTRIETQLHTVNDIEERLSTVERKHSWLLGAGSAFAVVLMALEIYLNVT